MILPEGYSLALNKFMRFFSDACGEDLNCVFLYIPPEEIENDRLVCRTDKVYLGAFEIACEKNNIMFIDCTPAFDELHEQNKAAHGFSNGGTAVGHINKYGHEAIARLLCERLG